MYMVEMLLMQSVRECDFGSENAQNDRYFRKKETENKNEIKNVFYWCIYPFSVALMESCKVQYCV